MRIPKSTTIRNRIIYYAYRAGFTLHPHKEGSIPSGIPGTYSLFDIRMNGYAHRSISMDSVVGVVTDRLISITK